MSKALKEKKLQEIASEIKSCLQCKKDSIGVAVVGEGNVDAKVVFIGEAPGKNEAVVGRPFIGRSGKLLRTTINSVGLKEEDVYITSPVKYLPERPARQLPDGSRRLAGGGTPTPAQIAHGKTHLDKQLAVIDPQIIVLLGSVAAQGVLGEKIAVMKEHGTQIKRNGKTYFLTIHPAAAIRFAKFRSTFTGDFQKLRGIIQ